MSYGDTVSATIGVGPGSNTFSFTGSPSDSAFMQITVSSGSLVPAVRIYRPNGSLLCTRSFTSPPFTHTCILDTAGQHAILASDANFLDGGDFELFLNGP